jgi:3-oxoadipate enol-lactonase
MLIEIDGRAIHYRTDGADGAPWVTFITGIANDTTMWDGQIAPLEPDFSILRYDLPGHGKSQSANGTLTLDRLMADLIGLWDGLGIEHSNLVGLGLGGALSIGMGAHHSDRLIRLVPCCCRAQMVPDFAAIWPGFIETVERGGMEAMVEPTIQRWFSDKFKADHPKALDTVRVMIRSTDRHGYIAAIRAFLTLDFAASLKDIAVPTLFISGTEDRIGGPSEIMSDLAAQVPGARHAAVPDAAHIANIQNQAGFNHLLADFLRA